MPSSVNIITHICINGCLCSFVFMSLSIQINLLLLLLPSSHIFQLICSLLAKQSDLNHLIGVSIWVPIRPRGPLAWLCNGWLCIDNTMQPPPIRPHQPPSHTSRQRLVMFDCVVFYILLFYIFLSYLLFVIHACLPLPPPSSRPLGLIHHRPAEACSSRWRCPMKEGPWGSM